MQVNDDHAFDRKTLQFRDGEPTSAERPQSPRSASRSTPRDASFLPACSRRARPRRSWQRNSAGMRRGAHRRRRHFINSSCMWSARTARSGESYPLPGEASADLPNFLNSLGVPDGHYSIYALAISRGWSSTATCAGRIVDPTDESQGGFDMPRGNVTGVAPIHPSQVIAQSRVAMPQMNAGRDMVLVAGEPASPELGHNQIDTEHFEMIADPAEVEGTPATSVPEKDEPGSNFAMPMVGGAIVVCTAATAVYATASHHSNPAETSPVL